jgi:hypothetical protein
MPGPEPDTVWIERYEGRIWATFVGYGWDRKARNRERRASTILRRTAARTWCCGWCGNPLPEWRRADAEYCREGCRKRAARARKEARPLG